MSERQNILFADSDTRVLKLLANGFKAAGYQTYQASSWTESLRIFEKENIHLVICESSIADEQDFSFLKKIRMVSKIPVMVLAQDSSELQRIKAFRQKADDFIAKPFSLEELILRAERLLFYFYEHQQGIIFNQKYQYPFMSVNQVTKEVLIHEKEVHLTVLEFQLLLFFVQHPGETFSRVHLLHDVWKYTYFGEERTVDTHIKRLRLKLRQYSETAAKSIKTVRGKGYCFDPNV